MTAAEYNERVRAAARTQRLPSFNRRAPGTFIHKWEVSIARPADARPASRLYEVTVAPGCVNDEPACIEYLAKDDPRGWLMPKAYPPYKVAQKLFGQAARFVDRPLWDTPAPIVRLTAPTDDPRDTGGFRLTPDQRRPSLFRTKEAWERKLYQASVFVTLSPFRADPAATVLSTAGARTVRWRIAAGQLPSQRAAGATGIAACELARIYLLRTPGKPAQDSVDVQQLVFWDLNARAIIDLPFLSLIGLTAEAAAAVDIGLLAFGASGVGLATALVGLETSVVAIVLQNLEDIIAATSGVNFWTV